MTKLNKLLSNPVRFFKDARTNRQLRRLPIEISSTVTKPPAKAHSKANAAEKQKTPSASSTKIVTAVQKAVLSFANARLAATVAIYFDGNMGNYYQLEQWLKPLKALDNHHPIAFILRDGNVFNHMKQTTSFTMVLCPTIDDLTWAYENNNFKCILYVNNGTKNFQSLINGNALHVHINHGESDKLSTVSNQSKAYDYVLVAGTAAIDKYNLNILKKNIEKYISIGRPQLEHIPEIPAPNKNKMIAPSHGTENKWKEVEGDCPHNPNMLLDKYITQSIEKKIIDQSSEIGGTNRKVVLYAPTWEATHDSMNYSSLTDYGISIVSQILADPRYYLIYKPHPNTGSRDTTTKRINEAILALLKDNAKGEAIISGDINSIYNHTDLAIFDNSAVAIDYLATDKPMLMTDMFHRSKVRRDTPAITRAARLISNKDVSQICEAVHFEIENDPLKNQRNAIKRYFLGEFAYDQGESTSKFIDTITKIIDEHRDLSLALTKMQEDHSKKSRFTNQI